MSRSAEKYIGPRLAIERPSDGGPAVLRLPHHIPAARGVPQLEIPESGLEPGQVMFVRLVKD